MANEPNKIIYSMIKVSKKYNQKQIHIVQIGRAHV